MSNHFYRFLEIQARQFHVASLARRKNSSGLNLDLKKICTEKPITMANFRKSDFSPKVEYFEMLQNLSHSVTANIHMDVGNIPGKMEMFMLEIL